MYHKKIIYLRELIFILNYVKYIKHYNVLNDVVREIRSKSGVGALLHPAEEYFVNCFNQQREKHIA